MKEKIIKVTIKPKPRVKVRVIGARDTAFEIKSKKKYPFMLQNEVNVNVETTRRSFNVTIPKGYIWNGADIPKTLFWVGQSKDNNYLVASLVHDYLLEHKGYVFVDILKNELSVKEYRRLTSLIFREILKDQDTNTIKANVMAWFVDSFQATINKKQWKGL